MGHLGWAVLAHPMVKRLWHRNADHWSPVNPPSTHQWSFRLHNHSREFPQFPISRPVCLYLGLPFWIMDNPLHVGCFCRINVPCYCILPKIDFFLQWFLDPYTCNIICRHVFSIGNFVFDKNWWVLPWVRLFFRLSLYLACLPLCV